MKQKYILGIGIFLFLILVNFASAEEVINYSYSHNIEGIQITSLKYDPYPVNPGEYFDIWIQAQLGDRDYAKFELIEEYPFSLDSNEEAVREYENLEYREVVMEYKIRVDKDAVDGVNELKINHSTSKSSNIYVIKSFPIQVSNVQTDFDLVIQESSEADVSIAIANTGKNTANALVVRIPEQDNYKVSETNGQMVGNLDSGDYSIVSFTLVQVSGGSDSNSLQVQFDYTDAIGERRSLLKEIEFSSGRSVQTDINGQAVVPGSKKEEMQEGNSSGQQNDSIFKSFWFWLIIVLIVSGSYWFYKKSGSDKSSGKNSKSKIIPDWMKNAKDKEKKK